MQRIRHLATALALAAMIAGQPALAEAPLALPASTPWNLNYADDSCELNRGFGQGDERIVLWFEKFAPRPGFTLIAIGRPIRMRQRLETRRGEVRTPKLAIAFAPEAPFEADFLPMRSAGGGPSLMSAVPLRVVGGDESQAPLPAERLARVESLTLDGLTEGPVSLATGPLDEPFAALETCIDDYVRAWGLDPQVQRNLSHPTVPLEDPDRWISRFAYPYLALLDGKQATLQFRMMIDAAGHPQSCHPSRVIGDEEFARVACAELMKNATLSPALDQDGQPTASYFIDSVTFLIR